MAGFNGLTFTVQPVITAAGAVNTAGLVAGTTLVAGILDPNSTQRIFNPVAEGNPVVIGTDSAATWLPVVKSLTATTVNDQYWAPAFAESSATYDNPNNQFGQVQLFLTPAAKNTVEASSVLNFYLSPHALVIVATGTF